MIDPIASGGWDGKGKHARLVVYLKMDVGEGFPQAQGKQLYSSTNIFFPVLYREVSLTNKPKQK